MAYTSAKMSLSVWDQLTDRYDHNQLADNWNKVDFHDHTLGRGVQIPTEGIADGAVTNAKLDGSVVLTIPDGSVTTAKLASQAVTTATLADLNVTTVKLADASVATAKLIDGNVTTQKIADANITKVKLATDALNAFLKLAVAADRKIAFGSGTWTWPGGVFEITATVAHTLGVTPIFAAAMPLNTGSTIFFTNGSAPGVSSGGASSWDATNVVYEVRCGFQPSAAGATQFKWIAIG